VAGFLAFATVMAGLFILIETRAAEPILPLSLYGNLVVSISMLITFLTGFSMFGAILFVPLFFQGVLGRSATSSGSFLTPMMLGIVVGAALSGQALSRFGGRYRLLGLVGLGIMALGMFLVSQMNEGTGFGAAVVYLVVMGFGLGTTFPVFSIAIMNSVPYRLLGAATSYTQFFRSIGGTVGLALFGSVLANRFASELLGGVSEGVKSVLSGEVLSNIAHNPQALVSPEAQSELQTLFDAAGPEGAGMLPQLMETLRSALSTAIAEVFLIGLAALVLSWLATLFLKEIRVRTVAPGPAGPGPGEGVGENG